MTGPLAPRILARVSVAIAALGIALVGYVYLASERQLRRTYDVNLTDIDVTTDSASIREGRRLAAIRGCPGCHGAQLEGAVFYEDFPEGRYVAPNLTRVASEYTAPELARAIRHGVRANGEGLWAMPSPMFYYLSDRDVGLIISYLRAAPSVEGGYDYEFRPGPLVRWGLLTGEWWAIPDDVAQLGPRLGAPAPTDTIPFGQYLARTSCTECHGNDLAGRDASPDLTIAAAYTFDDFSRLMGTGRALGDRELPVMSGVARSRFSHFTPRELAALYAFLQARARGSVPS
jgi:mono/diheme cytochrome c family protein